MASPIFTSISEYMDYEYAFFQGKSNTPTSMIVRSDLRSNIYLSGEYVLVKSSNYIDSLPFFDNSPIFSMDMETVDTKSGDFSGVTWYRYISRFYGTISVLVGEVNPTCFHLKDNKIVRKDEVIEYIVTDGRHCIDGRRYANWGYLIPGAVYKTFHTHTTNLKKQTKLNVERMIDSLVKNSIILTGVTVIKRKLWK